jgi:integrase
MDVWIMETNQKSWRYTRELLRDYVLILANSGMRVGEANNLRESDLIKFTDELGRENYRFVVDGKTGRREVVMKADAVRYIERTLERNALWKGNWSTDAANNKQRKRPAEKQDWLFRMPDGSKIITLADQLDNF